MKNSITLQCQEIYNESDLVAKIGALAHVVLNSIDRGLMVYYSKQSNGDYTFIKRSSEKRGILNLTANIKNMEFDGKINIKSSGWYMYVEIPINNPKDKSEEYQQKEQMLLDVGI